LGDFLGKPGGFLRRAFRINVIGHPIKEDANRAVSRFAEVITYDEDGETRIIGIQNNLCDCGAVIKEKSNALVGYCSCGALVCESCSVRCSECKALCCSRCFSPSILGDDVFCRRCRGGVALFKRILIGREAKK
jgi:hypothetical protein